MNDTQEAMQQTTLVLVIDDPITGETDHAFTYSPQRMLMQYVPTYALPGGAAMGDSFVPSAHTRTHMDDVDYAKCTRRCESCDLTTLGLSFKRQIANGHRIMFFGCLHCGGLQRAVTDLKSISLHPGSPDYKAPSHYVEEAPPPEDLATEPWGQPVTQKTITQWMNEIHKNAVANGWWDDFPGLSQPYRRENGDTLKGYQRAIDTISSLRVSLRRAMISENVALIHSELSEALEELREGRIETWFNSGRAINGVPKPEGFASELADVVIRCFDLAAALGIDLEAEMTTKIEYNEKRSRRHGGKAF